MHAFSSVTDMNNEIFRNGYVFVLNLLGVKKISCMTLVTLTLQPLDGWERRERK